MHQKHTLGGAALAAAMAAFAPSAAHAAVVPGTFQTITIDGDFSDWATVPVAATAAPNAAAPIDLVGLKVANDATNVYFLLTFNGTVNPQSGDGTYTAIDSDNDPATGYNVFGAGVIGSNFGFENNFPFTQATGNFNSGGTITNATFLAAPYNAATTQQEISIPLTAAEADASAGGYTGLLFPGTFTAEFYTDQGAGSVVGPVTYTLATAAPVPEPASLAVLAGAAAVPLARRRRRA